MDQPDKIAPLVRGFWAAVLPAGLLLILLTACGGDSAPVTTPVPTRSTSTASATAAPSTVTGGAAETPAATTGPDTSGLTGSGVGIWRKAVAATQNIHSMHIVVVGDNSNNFEYDIDGNDRMQIKSGNTTMLIIGNSSYMQTDGKWVKLSSDGTVTPDNNMPNPVQQLTELTSDAQQIENLGDTTLDGQAVHHLRAGYSVLGTGWEYEIWIESAGDHVVQIAGGVLSSGQKTTVLTIKYSKFNDPATKLEPPKDAQDMPAGIAATLTAVGNAPTEVAMPTMADVPTDMPQPSDTPAPTDTATP